MTTVTIPHLLICLQMMTTPMWIWICQIWHFLAYSIKDSPNKKSMVLVRTTNSFNKRNSLVSMQVLWQTNIPSLIIKMLRETINSPTIFTLCVCQAVPNKTIVKELKKILFNCTNGELLYCYDELSQSNCHLLGICLGGNSMVCPKNMGRQWWWQFFGQAPHNWMFQVHAPKAHREIFLGGKTRQRRLSNRYQAICR